MFKWKCIALAGRAGGILPGTKASIVALLLLLSLLGMPAQARDKIGLVDRRGKVIVPFKYVAAKHLGRGLFLFYSSEPDTSCHLLDYEGKPISIKLPPHCKLSAIFLPPDFEKGHTIAHQLPAGTTFRIHADSGYGLSRLDGTVLLEPKHGCVYPPNRGFYLVEKKENEIWQTIAFTFDSATGKRVAAPPGISCDYENTSDGIPFQRPAHDGVPGKYGYLTRDGKVLISARFYYAEPFGPDGIAAITQEGQPRSYINKKGESVPKPNRPAEKIQNIPVQAQRALNYIIWVDGPPPPPDRFFVTVQNDKFERKLSSLTQSGSNHHERFAELLHCYNIIGMSRKQLSELLGCEISTGYGLEAPSFCGYGPIEHVEFQFVDDKISKWRLYDPPGWADRVSKKPNPWVSTDVEFAWPEYHTGPAKLYSLLRPKGPVRRVTRECTEH